MVRPLYLNVRASAGSAGYAILELLTLAAVITWLLAVLSLATLCEWRARLLNHALVRLVFDPLLLRVDFTRTCWARTPWGARAWLAGAVGSDLIVQLLVGKPNALTALISLLTFVCFWYAPPRLTGAIGSLYIMQALGSLAVVLLLASFTEDLAIINVGALLWWAWCVVALVRLLLTYLRTPKALLTSSPPSA